MNKRFLIILVVFFTFGIITSYILNLNNNQSNISNISEEKNNLPLKSGTDLNIWPTASQITGKPVNYPNNAGNRNKFTISETGKINADKIIAETGENVNFSATIKNTGNSKKFLTHICFNHDKGVTFGCLLNKNLEPMEQFNINNTLQYTKSGKYNVYLTWSQDHTNFYKTENNGIARVEIK